MLALLQEIYGEEVGRETLGASEALMAATGGELPQGQTAVLSPQDAILITYADQVQRRGRPFLAHADRFLPGALALAWSAPSTCCPSIPTPPTTAFPSLITNRCGPIWGLGGRGPPGRVVPPDVRCRDQPHLGPERLVPALFARRAAYRDYFTVVEGGADLTAVFRPRALPLLTRVETAVGPKHVWTTFSPDQIDLNYRNPDVLLEVLETLLFYVSQGAEFIRLDAIAFMWKEIGTRCLHLPQTHQIIQLMRALLDEVAPHVLLITETNVPHEENISYFGDGRNEAQMVYNFSLPPLTLHTFHQGDATAPLPMGRWAAAARPATTFFNFLASHDGIGLTPARGFLSEAQIGALAERVKALGGFVSYRHQPDGSASPYELNINYLDALAAPGEVEDIELMARRFMAAQAIMLAFARRAGHLFPQPLWLARLAGRGGADGAEAHHQPAKAGANGPGAGIGRSGVAAGAGVWALPPFAPGAGWLARFRPGGGAAGFVGRPGPVLSVRVGKTAVRPPFACIM
jgi:glucosylglycerate phosphorylase